MSTPRNILTWSFNPFTYIAGAQALGLGLAAILLTGGIGSLSNTHFDGVLDTHSGSAAPLWFFLAEGILDWLCLGIVLWLCGKIISRTAFRAIDVFGTQALARWPGMFIAVLALPPAFQRFGNELLEQVKRGQFNFNTADAFIFFAVTIAMIPFLAWMVVLMYRAFNVSCNVKGAKAILTFIAGLVAAEVLSKLCLGAIVATHVI